jgi:GNAT superfamily N-acetyltransferase
LSNSTPIYTKKIEREDIGPIAFFISEIFKFNGLEDWKLFLSDIWDDNPAFPLDSNRGILLKAGNKIVGFLAKFPTNMQFDGTEILVANASGLSVHPDFRRTGIGTRLRKEYADSCKGTIMFATTAGTEVTRKINEKVGFKPLPKDIDSIHEIDSLIITNALEFAKIIFILLRLPNYLGFLTVILSWCLKGFNSLQLLRFKKKVSNRTVVSVIQLERADDSFDRLWEETKDYYMLTNVRTADVINWHLRLNRKSKKRLYACYRGGNLLGYMMIADIKIRNVDLKYCIDVWFKKGKEYGIGAIVDFIMKREGTQSFGAIILPHFNRRISNYLTSVGLFKVKGRKSINYCSAPKSMKEKLAPDNCYLVHIQGDRGIATII